MPVTIHKLNMITKEILDLIIPLILGSYVLGLCFGTVVKIIKKAAEN
jgi:hypothetical protein